MKSETLIALVKSIQHWQKNMRQESPHSVETGAAYCALCEIFNLSYIGGDDDDELGPCVELGEPCPVKVATGRGFCEGSPYEEAYYAWQKWSKSNFWIDRWRFHDAARRELEFLQSLLPNEDEKHEALAG
jgi:hypothetical protein